jgi:hypothetical protein
MAAVGLRAAAVLGAFVAILIGATAAGASSTQESWLQDDDQLVFNDPAQVAQKLDEIAALGVQTIRVSVIWAAIAPDPTSYTRPQFDATDPSAYPAGAWDTYDTLVRDAHARGVTVNFVLTGPIPYWATVGRSPLPDLQKDYSPNPAEFQQFAYAVGRRYSGSYVAGPAPPPPTPPALLGVPLGFVLGYPPQPANPAPLPAVSSWAIWNEPNEGGWLLPQWRLVNRKWVEASPALYRQLIDAGTAGLAASGHKGDRILIGETAARGTASRCTGCSMRPMLFLRALYCVSGSYKPLTQARARELQCPGKPDPQAFAQSHPELFGASGYAHHPYSFSHPPARRESDPQEVPLANLSRLEHALDLIFPVYGHAPGVPIFLTEYGYKSDPPNPFADFTQQQQAAFINQGEFIAYGDPRVKAFAQFLLVDDQPKEGEPVGSRSYWSTFQTGLIDLSGNFKPAFTAFRLPIWIPNPRHGRKAAVWGQIRPAPRGTTQTARLEFATKATSAFATIAVIETRNPQGFFTAHVKFPQPGTARLAWTAPGGDVLYSRATPIS